MPKIIKTDLCIIGGGSGGLSVAAAAAQMGAQVVLIEKRALGGECLHYGCVPSKSLIAAARAARAVHLGQKFGINVSDINIDYAKIHEHIKSVIANIAPHDSEERFIGLGVKVLKGSPKFINSRELRLNDQIIKAKYFVIATGSSPVVPPIEGISEVNYLTNETIFDLDVLPEHLMIIGGGPISCEMASAYSLLGSKVTLMQRSHIMARDEPELVAILRQNLRNDGVTLYEDLQFESVSQTAEGIKVTITKNEQTMEIVGSHLLVATGRKPNIQELDLEKAGIKFSSRGIVVDKRLRTNRQNIFALGDVTQGYQFTHLAGYQAGVVIRNALLRLPTKVNYRALPWVTYTEPELAHVGLTESQAREQFKDVKITTQNFTENDRAQTEGDTIGMIKVITRKNGLILGAAICGHNIDGLINLWGLAINQKLKLKNIAQMIIPYPTRSEISKQVSGKFYAPMLFSKRMQKIVRWLLKI